MHERHYLEIVSRGQCTRAAEDAGWTHVRMSLPCGRARNASTPRRAAAILTNRLAQIALPVIHQVFTAAGCCRSGSTASLKVTAHTQPRQGESRDRPRQPRHSDRHVHPLRSPAQVLAVLEQPPSGEDINKVSGRLAAAGWPLQGTFVNGSNSGHEGPSHHRAGEPVTS